jgi:hypothetical protein
VSVEGGWGGSAPCLPALCDPPPTLRASLCLRVGARRDCVVAAPLRLRVSLCAHVLPLGCMQSERTHLTSLPPCYDPSQPIEARLIPHGTNAGTLHFSHPLYPGLYEARFYANSDLTSLAGMPTTFLAKVCVSVRWGGCFLERGNRSLPPPGSVA